MNEREKTTKRTHKWFWSFDYDKLEKYFTDMHAKGWALRKPDGEGVAAAVVQAFEKCEPANVVYKIGYNAVKTDRDSYIKMFEDYGWEFIGTNQNYYYFRKNADGVLPEELDIFSDDGSRLDMAKKAVLTGLPLLLFYTFGILVPQTIIHLRQPELGWLDWVMIGIYSAALVLYLCGYTGAFLSYRRHKRQIQDKGANAQK